jgi:Pao retrotransposon peptidase
LTKAKLLSEISRLFDPIGWLSPVIINAKILMQSIWKENLNWNDVVPEHIYKRWEKFKIELKELQSLKIPREQISKQGDSYETYLIGFNDASKKAYCATIYLCSYDKNGKNSVSLVTSKNRVAPVQSQSLPRLELCAAELLAKLLPPVAKSLKINFTDMFGFTDSTLVLRWIQSEPYKFKTFISNRISKIQNCLSSDKWGFVRGLENPADCGSRGITVKEFLQHTLWWEGSPLLIKQQPFPSMPQNWTPEPNVQTMEFKTEQRAIV